MVNDKKAALINELLKRADALRHRADEIATVCKQAQTDEDMTVEELEKRVSKSGGWVDGISSF